MRKDKRYWGPVLIVIGLVVASFAVFASFALGAGVLWWTLTASVAIVLVGVTLVAAARQDA